MEVKNQYFVEKDGEEVVFKQESRKILNFDEAIREMEVLRHSINKVKAEKAKVEKAIADGVLEKQLEQLDKSLEDQGKLLEESDALMKPQVEKVKQDMRVKIKVAKAEKGWSRINDPNRKVSLSNEIIGPLATEFSLDMSNPIILELKREFDKT